jgi:hypothetical protein
MTFGFQHFLAGSSNNRSLVFPVSRLGKILFKRSTAKCRVLWYKSRVLSEIKMSVLKTSKLLLI